MLRDAKIGVTAVGITGTGVQVRLAKPEESDKAVQELKLLIQPIGNPMFGTSGQISTCGRARVAAC